MSYEDQKKPYVIFIEFKQAYDNLKEQKVMQSINGAKYLAF